MSGQPLTGAGVSIGQVEETRPGKRTPEGADDFQHSNGTIVPEDVFLHGDLFTDPPANMNIDNHAEYVAGVMISTDPTRTGVATGSRLYASAFIGDVDAASQAAESAQTVATVPIASVAAINFSFGVDLVGNEALDGGALLTQFVDWSASHQDVLYVVAGNEDESAGFPLPTDNFNGLTVAASTTASDGVYRAVADFNRYDEDAVGFRTSTDLLAPGEDIEVSGLGDVPAVVSGTSFAAPHVTGTVALLYQFANERFAAGDPRWDFDRSHRHEVMKAALLNSADKIEDTGDGKYLGMERTVLDLDGKDWLQSEAYLDKDEPFIPGLLPLDDQMGAGHLNAKRAVQQFAPGEYDSDGAAVPVIGWDYGHTSMDEDINRYVFDQELVAGNFISITIAWDRVVEFASDGGTVGQYDIGDTFQTATDNDPIADSQINDLDIYLMPKDAPLNFDLAVGLSASPDSTIDHIFAEIPTTREYEIWVHQFDAEVPGGQDYAIAWWYGLAPPLPIPGDYDGNSSVGPEDYELWKANFGTSFAAADGNGNGVVDAADYTVWRDHLGQSSGAGSLAAATVLEPSNAMLVLLGVAAFSGQQRYSC